MGTNGVQMSKIGKCSHLFNQNSPIAHLNPEKDHHIIPSLFTLSLSKAVIPSLPKKPCSWLFRTSLQLFPLCWHQCVTYKEIYLWLECVEAWTLPKYMMKTCCRGNPVPDLPYMSPTFSAPVSKKRSFPFSVLYYILFHMGQNYWSERF